MITQNLLQELFDYSNGSLVRKKTGKAVVCSPTKGQRYLRISINGKPTSLHRMIFLHQNGYLPECIDHIDGNKENNNINNLREVTQQQNCLNSKHRVASKSPYKNVYLQAPTKNAHWNRNWVVTLMVNKKRKYLGSFKDLELANLIATEARDLYHGQFARHF